MELQRDYQALRWWAILPLFVVLWLMNFLAHGIFSTVWRALPSGPDLSFLYYVVPGAWDTYQAYAACGYQEIGSFYAALLFFNAFGVVALDFAMVRALSSIAPIYKDKRLSGRAITRRCAGSAFWSIFLVIGIFTIDLDTYECRWVGEPRFVRALMHGLMAVALALAATPALRNGHRAG